MRTDVKLGLIGSLVVVVAAGWYLTGQDEVEPAILIGEDVSTVVPSAPVLSGITRQDAPPGGPTGHQRDLDQAGPAEDETVAAGEPLADLFAAVGEESGEPLGENNDRSADEASSEQEDGATATTGGRDREPAGQPSVIDTGRPDHRRQGATSGGVPVSEGGSSAGLRSSGVRMETHTIRPGDTIARLSRMYYGDIRYAKLLRRANPQVVDPTAMAVGTVIIIPDVSNFDPAEESPTATPKSSPAAPGQQVYTVQEGDTLYSIASEHLGTGSRWDELYQINKAIIGDDPGVLKVGQVLTLPPR